MNDMIMEEKQWKPNMAQINALTAAIKQVDKGNSDVLKGLKEKLMELFPELKENEDEDEKIRKELLGFIKNWKNPNNIGRPHDYPMFTKNEEQCNKYITWLEKQKQPEHLELKEEHSYICQDYVQFNEVRWRSTIQVLEYAKSLNAYTQFEKEDIDKDIAWLKKQKVTDEEIIFRPVAGTDIRTAAEQALEKIDIGKKVVLAFNGAYIPVNGKTVEEIIDNEYDAWLEKQGKHKSVSIVDKWNKEDEWKFSDILALLRGGENCHYNTPDLFEWLKSIKDKCTWKPDKEQMEYLHKYAEQNNYDGSVLTDLYNDLKQL